MVKGAQPERELSSFSCKVKIGGFFLIRPTLLAKTDKKHKSDESSKKKERSNRI